VRYAVLSARMLYVFSCIFQLDFVCDLFNVRRGPYRGVVCCWSSFASLPGVILFLGSAGLVFGVRFWRASLPFGVVYVGGFCLTFISCLRVCSWARARLLLAWFAFCSSFVVFACGVVLVHPERSGFDLSLISRICLSSRTCQCHRVSGALSAGNSPSLTHLA